MIPIAYVTRKPPRKQNGCLRIYRQSLIRNFNDPTIKTRRPCEYDLLTSAARNAPSMAWIAILTASLAYLNHTCCKFGKSCPTCSKYGSAVPAVPSWQRYSSSANLAALKQSKSSRCLTQKQNHLHNRCFWRTRDFVAPARCIDVYRLLCHTSSKLVHNSHTILKTVRLYW